MKTFSYLTKTGLPRSIYCVGKNYPDHAKEMASWEPEKLAP
jgi:fumarylpyruvate hydrolase